MGPKTRVLIMAVTIASVTAYGATDDLTQDSSLQTDAAHPDSAALQDLLREMQNLRARVQSLEGKLAEASAARPQAGRVGNNAETDNAPSGKAQMALSAPPASHDMAGMQMDGTSARGTAAPDPDDPHGQHA